MSTEYKITIIKNKEHFEVFINGEFYCSGDTYKECLDDVNEYLENKK